MRRIFEVGLRVDPALDRHVPRSGCREDPRLGDADDGRRREEPSHAIVRAVRSQHQDPDGQGDEARDQGGEG